MLVIYTPEENDFLTFTRAKTGEVINVRWANYIEQAELFDDEEQIIAILLAKDIQKARIKNNITSLSIHVLKVDADHNADFKNPVFEIKAKHKFSDN